MKLIPLIKYNPLRREKYENIYRLFTKDYVSTDGLKIPSIYSYYRKKKEK